MTPVSAERHVPVQASPQEWCQQQCRNTRLGATQNISMSSSPSPRWDSLRYDESCGCLQGS